MFKVGVIGCGGISEHHHRGFVETGRATISKVYDIEPSRAKHKAEQWGADAVSASDELVSSVDIAVVATPGFARREYIELAVDAGVHIMCEKPIALSIDEALTIGQLAERSAGIFMMSFSQRYDRELATLQAVAASGQVGGLVSAWVRWHAPAPSERWRSIENAGHWRSSFELSGGRITEFSSHAIDWLLWVLGEPRSVYGKALHVTEGFTLDDANYAMIDCKAGTGMLDVSRHAGVARTRSYGIMGHRGSVVLDRDRIWLTLMDEQSVPVEPVEIKSKHEQFIDCITHGTQPPTGIQAGINAARVCLAFNRSAHTGAVEAVP